MDSNKIIDELGGTSEVARICNVQPPSVSEWRKTGIPEARLMFLRLLRPDVFTSDVADKTETVSECVPTGPALPSAEASPSPDIEPIHECASGDPRYHSDRRQYDKRQTERRHPGKRQAPRRKEAD